MTPFRLEPLERRDCPAAFILTPITATVTEGNAAEFRVSMTAPSSIPQAVVVSTEAITATLGSDYMHRTQRITFFPGETQKSIFVQSLVDPVTTSEGFETLRLIVTPVGGTPAQLTATIFINDYVPPDPFVIEFSFDSSVPTNVQSMFQAAADRWQNVIVGDLPDVRLPNGQIVDDLLINVTMANLPAGVIAQAGFTDIRVGNSSVPANGNFSQNGLPYIGDMEIGNAFVNAVGLPNVIAHEMGHVLGFGTLWQNNVGTFPSLVSGIGSTNPVYVGANAVREYNNVFGVSGTSVPLYQVSRTNPPSYDGSYGTHWRDSVFDSTSPTYDELMTATYNAAGVNGVAIPAYLSRITVGALDDFGYKVSYDGAEAYRAPGARPNPVILPLTTLPADTRSTSEQLPMGIGTTLGPFLENAIRNVRQLPPRISYVDRAPVILSDSEASRELVWESLRATTVQRGSHLLDLTGLDPGRKAALMAWATYAAPHLDTWLPDVDPNAPRSAPRLAPGVFGSIAVASA